MGSGQEKKKEAGKGLKQSGNTQVAEDLAKVKERVGQRRAGNVWEGKSVWSENAYTRMCFLKLFTSVSTLYCKI